jgi:anti-sigma regulatory factor (Ser/Thr protein kinase)
MTMNRQTVAELRSARSRTGDARLLREVGAADLRSVAEVRHALRALLDGRAEPDRCATAELLTSELLANALVHTDGEAVVTAVVSGRRLRVEVRDFAERGGGTGGGSTGVGPGARSASAAGDEEAGQRTSGRGLLLVRALADAWGVRAHDVGKSVWFELEGLTGAEELRLDGDAA